MILKGQFIITLTNLFSLGFGLFEYLALLFMIFYYYQIQLIWLKKCLII